MIAFLLEAAIVFLVILHVGWLALFALEILFDTTRCTAAERWRNIRNYFFFGIGLECIIVILVTVRWFQPGWFA